MATPRLVETPQPEPKPEAGGPDLAVVTVGTTTFADLVRAVLVPEFLEILPKLGVRRVLVQYGSLREAPLPPDDAASGSAMGKGKVPSAEEAWARYGREHLGLELRLVRYTDDMDDLLGNCNIAITHAGSGSILSVLRAPLPEAASIDVGASSSIVAPLLIVVANPTLMDAHQSELADAIEEKCWGVSATPSTLVDALKKLAVDHHAHREQRRKVLPLPGRGPARFRAYLDNFMGYT